MISKDFSKIITLGITGYKDYHWREKLEEIDELKIDRVSLFLERFDKIQRSQIYKALLKSNIREIPLVHIRNDMSREELKFLAEKYSNPYFTIHENGFKYLDKWKGFHKNIYLEMNYDNYISANIKIEKIGGFCVDLAHFKASEEKWSKDFEYIVAKRKNQSLFKCSHLSGYSFKNNADLHVVKKLSDFDYLKSLPTFIFGNIIAIEVDNSIREQMNFREYIIDSYGY